MEKVASPSPEVNEQLPQVEGLRFLSVTIMRKGNRIHEMDWHLAAAAEAR